MENNNLKIKRPQILTYLNLDDLKKDIQNCTIPRCNADCDKCKEKELIIILIEYIYYLEEIKPRFLDISSYIENNEIKKQELINFSEFKEIVKISKLKEESLKQLNIEKFIEAFNHWLKTIASDSSFNYQEQKTTLKKLGDIVNFTFNKNHAFEAMKLIAEKEPKFNFNMVSEKRPDGETIITLSFTFNI